MTDANPPVEPLVEEIKRRNEQAFNRMRELLSALKKDLLHNDQDGDDFSGTTPAANG